jgi:hypothetical protein
VTAEEMAGGAPHPIFSPSGPSIEAMTGEQIRRSGVDVMGADAPATFRAQVEITRTRGDMAFESVIDVVRRQAASTGAGTGGALAGGR